MAPSSREMGTVLVKVLQKPTPRWDYTHKRFIGETLIKEYGKGTRGSQKRERLDYDAVLTLVKERWKKRRKKGKKEDHRLQYSLKKIS